MRENKNLAVRPLKKIEDNVFEVWKNWGETPLQTLKKFRSALELDENIKLTYAGRLDPAAEGLLLILIGEKCKEKETYLGLDKEYKFEVLFGATTDTLDLLGIPQVNSPRENLAVGPLNKENLIKTAENLVGKHAWPYPAYSSKTHQGKAMWQYAREGEYQKLVEKNDVPINNFEIYHLEFIEINEISATLLWRSITNLTDVVEGDFRQKEINKSWRDFLANNTNQKFVTATFKTICSSGTYVRQIAQNIGQNLNISSLASKIIRTRIIY